MATGRTLDRWTRVYADSSPNMPTFIQSIGPLITQFNSASMLAMNDNINGGFNTHPTISPTVLNTVVDSRVLGTTGGFVAGKLADARVISIVIGMRAAPVDGDPVFTGEWYQDTDIYDAGDMSYVTAQFGDIAVDTNLSYDNCWGHLVHASSAETGVNSSTGIDDYGAQTEFGGFMTFHRINGDGTATVTIEHADANNDGSFGALTGATTGEIDWDTWSATQWGIVELSKTETVKRYLRWQVSLNTATTLNFILVFVRALW